MTTEVVAVSISAVAVLVSLWFAIRQSKRQARLLHLEEAEERRRTTAEQSAKLRAKVEQRAKEKVLLVSNEGAAGAQNISIKIDGTPILEHHIVVAGQEMRQLGPGGEACYYLALMSGTPLSVSVEISWSDEAGAAQNWISNVALF